MSDSAAVLMVGLMGSCVLSLIIGAIGFLVWRDRQKKKNAVTTTPAPEGDVPVGLEQTSKYKIKRGNTYLTAIYNASKPRGSQCDLGYTTDASKGAPFVIEKSGNGYLVKADCDLDGNFTSYMSEDANDLLQPLEPNASNIARQQWDIACLAKSGCAVKNLKTGTYLSVGDAGGGISTARTRVTFLKI